MPRAATRTISSGMARYNGTAAQLCDTPPRHRLFEIDRMKIAAIVSRAQGRPVLLLHGNSSSKSVWVRQIRLLSQAGRSLIVPDLPGHGESSNACDSQETYSFPGYAGVIRRLLDLNDCGEVDVVGWSLGGHIGLELLGTEPRVRSLLIVGTPPVRPSVEALHAAFHADDDMQLAGKPNFSAADAETYGKAMLGGSRYLTRNLLEDIRRTDGNARRFMFENALRSVGVDQRSVAEMAAKPLCVVHGEKEPFVRLSYLRSIRYRALWGDRIHVIAGAGHAPHWQTPAAFNEILKRFLGFNSPQNRGL